MGTISLTLPSDGSTAEVSDYNTPINTIKDEFNGNIDNDNIKSNAGIAGSKLADSAVTTAKIADDAITGAKISSYKVNVQAKTTNSVNSSAKIQTGWGQILGAGTAFVTITVTFPVAFTSAPNSIVLSCIGYKSGGTAATDITQFNSRIGNVVLEAINITSTNFLAVMSVTSGTMGAAYHGFSWTAIGS